MKQICTEILNGKRWQRKQNQDSIWEEFILFFLSHIFIYLRILKIVINQKYKSILFCFKNILLIVRMSVKEVDIL